MQGLCGQIVGNLMHFQVDQASIWKDLRKTPELEEIFDYYQPHCTINRIAQKDDADITQQTCHEIFSNISHSYVSQMANPKYVTILTKALLSHLLKDISSQTSYLGLRSEECVIREECLLLLNYMSRNSLFFVQHLMENKTMVQ